MHEMLMDSAVGENHAGTPGTLKVDHKCVSIDHEAGLITFENGVQAKHDLIVGADGIGVNSHPSFHTQEIANNHSLQSARPLVSFQTRCNPHRRATTASSTPKMSAVSDSKTSHPAPPLNSGAEKTLTRLFSRHAVKAKSTPFIASSRQRRVTTEAKAGTSLHRANN